MAPRDKLSRFLYSRALTYFLAVADTLSIRAAARQLNIASSAVNRQILQLEEAIGMPLFERRNRALTLSPAGAMLAEHARNSLADLQAALDDIEALPGLGSGIVHIATIESFASGLLSSIVLDFSRRYPFIKIDVSVQPSLALAKLVAAGDADVGFTINPPANPPFEVARRWDITVGAIVAPSHPLAKRRTVTVADCLAYPVLRGRTPKIRAAIDAAVGANAKIPNFIESNSSRFKAALVRKGDFVAFSPSFALEPQIADGSLVFVPIAGPSVTGDCFAVIAHRKKMAPAPTRFLEFACDMIAQHQQLFSPTLREAKKRRGKT